MMKNTNLTTQASSGIVLFALLSAMVQADSVRHSELHPFELDGANASITASEALVQGMIEAELDAAEDQAIWEIDIVNEANQVITVEVDARSGQIISTRQDDNTELTAADVVQLAKAIDAVMAVEKGALVEADQEHEHGNVIWEVATKGESNRNSRIRIDPETGEILV
ncbi:MAG: PepSY domain-containing protein [Granulosicoccus sp.]